MMFSFLVASIAILLGYLALVRPFQYWNRLGVPQKRVWENVLNLILKAIQYFPFPEATRKVYDYFPGKRYCGTYRLFTPTLTIRDPDLIKQILVRDFDHFEDHFNFFPEFEDPLWTRNLFFLKGDQWRNMRVKLSPFFTSSKLKITFNLISDCAKQFVEYFEEEADKNNTKTVEVEAKDMFARFASDVIATTAYGITCDSMRQPNNDFYLMGKRATTFGGGIWDSIKFILVSLFPKFAKMFKINITEHEVNMYFKDVVKRNIHLREKEGIVRPDMIHLLLEARKELKIESPNSQPNIVENFSTDDDIAAQIFLFFLAGFDSAATLMAFMAYELALHPSIQDRLQNEIDSIRSTCGDNFSYECLSRMKYIDMIMSETLRKWPNGLVIDRICTKPYTIEPVGDEEKAVHLQKGCLVHILLFGLQRDPLLHPNPDRFDPDRFNEDNKDKMHPYSNIPFGGGPRFCIGTRFTFMETKTVFFYLLSKFDIIVVDRTSIPLKLNKKVFQLDAENGFWLGLRPRKL